MKKETINIPQKEWKMKECNKKNMREKGFRYYPIDNIYILSFPIYPLKKMSGCFICMITVIAETLDVQTDLYKEDIGINNYYPQFYHLTNNGYAKFINKINNIILNKFKELEIYKVKK